MATTLTGDPQRADQTVTLNATPANCTQVNFPEWARSYTLQLFESDDATTEAGEVAGSGTDGGAIGGGATTVAAGQLYSATFAGRNRVLGGHSIFIRADTASAKARLSYFAE